MSQTVFRTLRVRKDLADWFDEVHPYRGSFPQFVNHALEEYKRQYGDRQPPHKLVQQAVHELAGKL